MDSRPVFIIVAADNCGACKNFKPRWPEVKSALEATGKVRVVEAFVPKIGTPIEKSKAPEALNRMIGYYPTLALFPGKLWNDAFSTGKLDGEAFNASKKGGRFDAGANRYSMSKEGILSWVNDILSTPSFRDQPQVQIPVQPLIPPTDPRNRNPFLQGTGTKYIPTSGSSSCSMKIVPKKN